MPSRRRKTMRKEAKMGSGSEIDVDRICNGVDGLIDTFRKLGGLALRCAMTGRIDLVFKIRGAFSGVVKAAESTGGLLDGIVELKDEFHGGE